MKLRSYQDKSINLIRNLYARGTKRVLLHLATGGGKCHGKGTKILMHSGDVKNVEDIVVGDLIMGDDSTPRKVLSLARGQEELFEVIPIKGEKFVCNRSHILSLMDTVTNEIINISIDDYLKTNKTFKHCKKLWRTEVHFEESEIKFDPYMIGLYLAEGTYSAPQITNPDKEVIDYAYQWASQNDLLINNKNGRGCRELYFKSKKRGKLINHCNELRKYCTAKDDRFIPREYKINSKEVRLKVLAGLLDGDGYLRNNYYEIVTKYVNLKNDILFLARSLGFAAHAKNKTVNGVNYFRINIFGNVDQIPCLIPRKKAAPRRQIKNVLKTGFSLKSIGIGDYYGFEITGNHLYLLDDFTVTHNTLIFCHIMKSAALRGKKCVMIVRGRELVDQGSMRLAREGVDHGVLMANHWRQDFNNPIQVCSVDTLRSRKIIPDADLVVIDEAHLSGGASYQWLLSEYQKRGAYILGVTATPHCKDGLRHIADEIVYPISIGDLIEQGYLVPPVYYAPLTPDLTGVKVKAGEYDEKQLFEKMNVLVGDLVSNWKRLGENRATICFAVDVQHSKNITKAFNDAGVPCEHIDANSTEQERKAALDKLESGKIKIISNCGILCTGVDMPYVKCILMARPTKSYNLYIQQCGRGTRLYEGKKDFLILDHAGNIERHGFIEKERIAELDPQQKKKKKEIEFKIPSVRTCEQCFAVFAGTLTLCPRCGHGQKQVIKELMHIDGELVKISDGEQTDIHVKIFINELKETAKRRGYKRGWIYHRLKDKFGDEIASKYMPKKIVPDWIKRRPQSVS